MYSDIILNRLNNLTYLKPLKGSNITATSKKNNYNDIVKFYAKIDTNEVIQSITFKATGCTYFLVFCDYFCSIVEGKTIKEALKVDNKKLYTLMELTDNKNHVIEIILATFQLLVKKYRKGLEKGTITAIDENSVAIKDTTTKKKPDKNTKTEKLTGKTEKSTSKQEKNVKVIKSADVKEKSVEMKEQPVKKKEKSVEKKENSTNVKAKNKNATKDENVKNLSSMLNRINSKKTNEEKLPNDERLKDKNTKNTEIVEKENNRENKLQDNAKVKNEPRKGLFSWFRRNK